MVGYEWPYETVRACRSTGAPESTAAGVTSPGSLPSITRLGIGENALILGLVDANEKSSGGSRTYDVR